MIKRTSALNWLVPLIALLALIVAGVGLFTPGGEGSYPFTNVHGQVVEMYGRGLYENDSLLAGAGFRGTDAVALFVVLPLLLWTYFAYRRGSQNGEIALIGVLFFFLYYGASMTFAAMFNALFLVYTALFSTSLFAVIVALVTFDIPGLAARVQPTFPRRGLAIFMFVAGIGTLLIWMSEVIPALVKGQAPAIVGPYTTLFTHAFDSAVITPAAVVMGIFLLRRKPVGYLLAAPILILCTLVGVVVIGQTISQAMAGLIFPVGVYIGMIGSWVVLGGFAIGLLTTYYRKLS